MRYNVPRLGPAGGYVHAEAGSLLCVHKFQIIARYGDSQRGCETSDLRGVWAAAEHELCHGADEVRIVVNRNYKHQNAGTQRPGASDAPIATESAPPGSLK